MSIAKTGCRRRTKARKAMLASVRDEARRMRALEIDRRAKLNKINQPQLIDEE